MREQIELLEYHTHALTQLIDIARRICNRRSFEDDLAAGRLLQQIQAAQECGFTRSGRTDHYNFFPFFNMLVNSLQHHMVPEGFLKIFSDDHPDSASFPACPAVSSAGS